MRLRRIWVLFLLFEITTAAAQPSPDTLWMRYLGNELEDFAKTIISLPDRGFLVGGETENHWSYEDSDIRLHCTDSLGMMQWLRQLGDRQHHEELLAAVLTPDTCVVLSTVSWELDLQSGVKKLIKLNLQGDTLWMQHPDGYAREIRIMDDGQRLLMAGMTGTDSTGSDYWLAATDEDGNLLWQRSYGGHWRDECQAFAVTRDRGYLLAGNESSRDEWVSIWIVRTDADGDTLWTRSYGGVSYDEAWAIDTTRDGGFIFGGHTQGLDDDTLEYSLYIVRADSVGNIVWERTYQPDTFYKAYSIHPLDDGGWILSGDGKPYTASDSWIFVMRIDSAGEAIWFRTYEGDPEYEIHHNSLGKSLLTPDGGLVVMGTTRRPQRRQDILLFKLGPQAAAGPGREAGQPAELMIDGNYPNPFNGQTRLRYRLPRAGEVTFEVFDVLGRVVRSETWPHLEAGTHEAVLDGSELPSGVYLGRISSAEAAAVQKMLLLK